MKSILRFQASIFAIVIAVAVAAAAEPVRILAIGNSFSRDAIEEHLYELCAADSTPVIIGNMYIGGCRLERHLRNANDDIHDYSYRKIVDGHKTTTPDFSLAEALADEPWDYISLQESSGISGIYANYAASLPALIDYIAARAPQAKLIWHQTWAYSGDSDHGEFPNYLCNQQQMYLDILACSHRAATQFPFAMVVPCGTAIQNARSSTAGDTLNRDGFHLAPGFGRFTAACTWYEQLFGRDVRHNPYAPASVAPHLASIAKASAHAAVLRPFAPTLIYQ